MPECNEVEVLVRRNAGLLAGLLTVLLAVLLILLTIPVTVVTGYIPASVTSHKLTWITGLAVGVVAAAMMTWWLWRRSASRDLPPAAVDSLVIVGEIPRQPTAFVPRAEADRLAAAAGSGRVAVLCAVTGMRGLVRRRSRLPMPVPARLLGTSWSGGER